LSGPILVVAFGGSGVTIGGLLNFIIFSIDAN
jgi:hypothetical protein